MAPRDTLSALPKVDRFGLNVHHYEYEAAAFPLVAEARVGWVRLAAWWRFMEGPRERQRKEIDFGYLDRSVDSALAHGLKVLIVFASIPAWANGTPPELGIIDKKSALPPANPQFFRDFVTAVVTRYRGRVGHYEIWNEPNYKEFWNGNYGRFIDEILISGAQAVKAADPTALTMGPATDKNPEKFEAAVSKACNFLDILSCHLYVGSAGTLLNQADSRYLPLLKNRCNKPLWVTEFGIDSWEKKVGEDVQAKELVAALDGLRQRAYLERLFLFEWRDGHWPHKNQKGWGLVSNDIEGFRRKKSFWAVQDLALRWLRQPGVALSPQPADGATQVPLTTPLIWKAGRDALSHRISLGTESPAFQREQTETTFPASAAVPQEPGRTYLWRVDEVKDGRATDGSLWRFTTAEDPASADAPVIVRVQESSPFFLGVSEGQGRAECAPVRSLVLPNTSPETAQGAWTVKSGPEDLNFLLPAGRSVPDALTISVSGLHPGTTYRVFGRFAATPQQAARQAAIRMGLGPGSMTLYRADSPGAKLVRKIGRWEEREVEIGSFQAASGGLQVLLDAKGAAEPIGWTGLRLETETA